MEHAEIPFRDNFGETVLAILWNYFGETARDIIKYDFRRDFGREFECGRYNTQVSIEQCCEVLYPNPKGSPRYSKVLWASKGPPPGPPKTLTQSPKVPRHPKGPTP